MKEWCVDAAGMMADQREKIVIDLRRQEDFRKGSCPGAENIYWKDLESSLEKLPKEKPLYLLCYTGETSDEYAQLLWKKGYEVYSVQEGYRGFLRWKLRHRNDPEQLDPAERQKEITRKGNPRKPQGEEGGQMLRRMNQSHASITGWALDFFKFEEGDRVLDIGCGGGAALHRMAQQIRSGHLTGVDYSEVSVRESMKTNEKEILDGKMDILQASVEKLPFAEESFDKILTVESFYFWPDPAQNLKEVRRVLKRGGVFLLASEIYQKEGLTPEVLENIREYQLYTPTKEEYEKLFTQAGFSSVKLHTREGFDWICVEGRAE